MGHDGVIAVDRSIALLAAFRPQEEGLTLATWAARSQLHKTTVLRIAASLERAGFVRRLSDGRYSLGPAVLTLAMVFRTALRLDDHVVPFLSQLASDTGESASFYISEGYSRVCVARIDPVSSLRDAIVPGSVLPLDKSATGRVLTEFAEVRDRWPKAPIFTSKIGDSLTASLSCPVFDAEDRLMGAITISGPAFHFDDAKLEKLRGPLIETAAQISASFGCTGYPALSA